MTDMSRQPGKARRNARGTESGAGALETRPPAGPGTGRADAAGAAPAQNEVVETRFAYREPLVEKYPRLAGVSEELIRCIKCGMCRAVCPTLLETVSESQGARGRVSLVEAVLDGRLALSDIFDDRISTCLNCKACIQACPSGVRVDDIILAARAELVSRGRFPFVKRLLMRGLLKRGRLLPPVGKAASLFQRALLAVSPKGSALRLLLPAVRINRERKLPVFAPRSFIERLPAGPLPAADVPVERTPAAGGREPAPVAPGRAAAEKARRLKVAYFTGCSANLIYTNIAVSVVDVLNRLGVEVHVPREQGCCGLPVLNAGDFVTAREMARKNVEMLKALVDRERLDAVVVSCSSCGLALRREYSKVLGVDVAGLSGLVMDVSEFIVKKVGLGKLEALLAAAPAPGAGKDTGPGGATVTESEVVVTYHDPCHLRRGQGVKDEPRQIIAALPGVRFVEMRDPDRCCGGAGLYSFTHYDMSRAIAAHKVSAIVDTGAEVVLTGCASCIMQIEDALRQAGRSQRVAHLVEFVSERLRGRAAPTAELSCSEKR